jgi:hypothetical protein
MYHIDLYRYDSNAIIYNETTKKFMCNNSEYNLECTKIYGEFDTCYIKLDDANAYERLSQITDIQLHIQNIYCLK